MSRLIKIYKRGDSSRRKVHVQREQYCKKLYCGCKIYHKVDGMINQTEVLYVEFVSFCAKHMDRATRELELEKAKKEMKMYKKHFERLENEIDISEDKDASIRELLEVNQKLKAAELEFFSLMDISVE